MQSAGMPTSLEPNCSRVAGSNPVTSAGDRANIICVLQDRLLLSDVSVTHYCVDKYVVTAAATAGSAPEARAAKMSAKYASCEPGGYDFNPLVVESYGRQCSATHALLNLLGHLAADSGRVTKGAWIEGALQRLSVTLCKGNDFLFRTNLHAFYRAAGKQPTRGAAVHYTIEV